MLTEKLLLRRKLLAALVMTGGLATLVSTLGIQVAGNRTVDGQAACSAVHLKGAMLPLELGAPPELGRTSAACFLRALDAMLDADTVFLISYSALNLTLFLFLAGLGRLRPAFLWCLAGGILSVVMLLGDWFENQALYQWVGQARHTLGSGSPSFPAHPPSFLALATDAKWIALAVAGLLLGVAYLFQRPWLLKLLILPAALCAGLIGMGVYRSYAAHDSSGADQITHGMSALAILWTGGLLHSIVVALQPLDPRRGR